MNAVLPEAQAMRWMRSEVGRSVDVPLPGSGATLERWRYLAAVAADDLVHARLIEGHLDAVAILAELGRSSLSAPWVPQAVWAADPGDLAAHPRGGRWVLEGTKRYCSGSVAVDAALVTATGPDGPLLLLLGRPELDQLAVIPGSWPSTGMAASASVTLRFGLAVDPGAVVAGPDAYVNRRGFWVGGAGVAMCWFGGAVGVLDGLARDRGVASTPGAMERLGRERCRLDAIAALARETVQMIDDQACPIDELRRATVGLRVAAADAARAVLVANMELGGSRLLATDDAHSRRSADLAVYVSQLAAGVAAELESSRTTGPML